MDSSPQFTTGDAYASYRGPAIDVTEHRHAAFQVAIAVEGEVTIVDSAGRCHRGVALVVSPMIRHRMLPGTNLLTFFVEPQCAFADHLRERWGEGVAVADELQELDEDEVRLARPSGVLDARLVEAMDAVTAPGASMEQVASQVDLSPHRLRALARRQLGMPLPRWRAWARLRRAAEALAEGQSLADAALEGGFADQAHMNRWMREMMGITPGTALPVLRAQSRDAT